MLLLVILTYKQIKVRGGQAGSLWSAVPSPPRQLPGELGVSGEVAESGVETGEQGGPGLAALDQCTGVPGRKQAAGPGNAQSGSTAAADARGRPPLQRA